MCTVILTEKSMSLTIIPLGKLREWNLMTATYEGQSMYPRCKITRGLHSWKEKLFTSGIEFGAM